MKKWLIAIILFLIVSFVLWVLWKIIRFGFFLLGIGVSFFSKHIGIIVIMVVAFLFIYMKFSDRLLEMKMYDSKKQDGINTKKEIKQSILSQKQIAAMHENHGDRIFISSKKSQRSSQLDENEQHTKSILVNVATKEIAGNPVVDDISVVLTLEGTAVNQSFFAYVKSLHQQQIQLLLNEVYDELQLKYKMSVIFGEMGAKEFVQAVLLMKFNPKIAHKVMVGIEKIYENKFNILQFSEYMDTLIAGSDIPYMMWRDTYYHIESKHRWIKEHPCSKK